MVSTESVGGRVDAEAGFRATSDCTVIAPVTIDQLVGRIAADHPELSCDAIEAAVVESLRQTSDARVHTFRLVVRGAGNP